MISAQSMRLEERRRKKKKKTPKGFTISCCRQPQTSEQFITSSQCNLTILADKKGKIAAVQETNFQTWGGIITQKPTGNH